MKTLEIRSEQVELAVTANQEIAFCLGVVCELNAVDPEQLRSVIAELRAFGQGLLSWLPAWQAKQTVQVPGEVLAAAVAWHLEIRGTVEQLFQGSAVAVEQQANVRAVLDEYLRALVAFEFPAAVA